MVSCPYKKMEKNTLYVRYDRSPFTTQVFACVPGTLDYGNSLQNSAFCERIVRSILYTSKHKFLCQRGHVLRESPSYSIINSSLYE
jgi:hypothetical protein